VSEISDVPQFCFDRRQVQAFNLGCEAPDAGGPPPGGSSPGPGPKRPATGGGRLLKSLGYLGMLDPTGLPVNLPPLHSQSLRPYPTWAVRAPPRSCPDSKIAVPFWLCFVMRMCSPAPAAFVIAGQQYLAASRPLPDARKTSRGGVKRQP
jgi:hypothetical protein